MTIHKKPTSIIFTSDLKKGFKFIPFNKVDLYLYRKSFGVDNRTGALLKSNRYGTICFKTYLL